MQSAPDGQSDDDEHEHCCSAVLHPFVQCELNVALQGADRIALLRFDG